METQMELILKLVIMEKFFNYFCFVLLLLLTACQNEDNIGYLYGQWLLKNSHVNGENKQSGNIYFSFQGKVIWVKSVNADNHTYNDVFGNFKQKGDSLLINFVQKSELTTTTSLIEERCGFTDADNVRLLIKNLDSSELILSEGDNYWTFEKF